MLYEYKYTLPEQNDKKVNLLVTGGCGFIGSNFVNYYFPKNKVDILVNLDAMYYCASEDNVDESIRNSDNYKLIKGNLQNFELVQNILSENEITHIIHFADKVMFKILLLMHYVILMIIY